MNNPKSSSTCLLCDNSIFVKQVSKGSWDIVKCSSCGFLFVHPLPSAEEIGNYYNRQKQPVEERISTYLKTRASRTKRDIRKLKVLESFKRGKGKVLDIGCGLGLFVKNAQQRGWLAQGIDLDREMVEYGKQALKIDLACAELGELKLPAGYFDVITMFNLLDHLRSPLDFLKEVERVLKPDGIIYMNLHDAGGWKAKKKGAGWGAFCPPAHLYYYDPETLGLLLDKAGLRPLRAPGLNFKEGIKLLIVKKASLLKTSVLRKKLDKTIYSLVQKFKL